MPEPTKNKDKKTKTVCIRGVVKPPLNLAIGSKIKFISPVCFWLSHFDDIIVGNANRIIKPIVEKVAKTSAD